MYKDQKISLVFPAYNEEKNIKNAIDSFNALGLVDEIVVVDNNSSDKTAEEIKKTNAKYVLETKQGYGNALIRGMSEATGDFIVTCEPDGTFYAKDLMKLLVYSSDFEVVFGTRTSKECIWSGANMNWFLRVGNWFVAKLLEYTFNGPSLTDVGCTFKLMKRSAYDVVKDKFTVGTSHFSPELMILCIKNNLKTVEIPVNYGSRIGESKITGSTWNAFKLGLVMIWLIVGYRVGLK